MTRAEILIQIILGDFLMCEQALGAVEISLFFRMQLGYHFLSHGTQYLPLGQQLLHQTGITGLLLDSSTRQ